MKTLVPALATLCAACAMPASANDTMAELQTGGLVSIQTGVVAMEEEDLYISRSEVRVDYVFRNTSERDIEAVVAFPMPDIVGEPESNVDAGDNENDNFLGFSVVQDGVTITPELDQRVIAIGVDRTEDLRKAGVPLLPYAERTWEAIKALPAETRLDFATKGLIAGDSGDDGQELYPLWTLKSTYWWKTAFPADKPVRVRHRYKPSVGGTVDFTVIDEGPGDADMRAYRDLYCIDNTFAKLTRRLARIKTADGNAAYTENWVSYVLSTGANWAGPIGRFRLTIDKENPDDYVSFCGDGVKKTGATTFVMEKKDFVPEDDLDILFLSKTKQE